MTPDCQKVEEIFHAALDCEPNQLDAFLNEEEFCDAEMEGRGDAGNGAGETVRQRESETEEFIWSTEPEKDGTTKQHEMIRKMQEKEKSGSAIPNPKSDCIPWAAGLARRTVYDLMWGEDGYGREIFIESEDEHTGKPTVWYLFDKAGHKIRHERNMFCVRTERLGASAYL